MLVHLADPSSPTSTPDNWGCAAGGGSLQADCPRVGLSVQSTSEESGPPPPPPSRAAPARGGHSPSPAPRAGRGAAHRGPGWRAEAGCPGGRKGSSEPRGRRLCPPRRGRGGGAVRQPGRHGAARAPAARAPGRRRLRGSGPFSAGAAVSREVSWSWANSPALREPWPAAREAGRQPESHFPRAAPHPRCGAAPRADWKPLPRPRAAAERAQWAVREARPHATYEHARRAAREAPPWSSPSGFSAVVQRHVATRASTREVPDVH
jgi:hypothetical protein